tara:strand:+ start:14941 stop:15510 length:570 start_codon:yes stop_codon:yes gene_type:complete
MSNKSHIKSDIRAVYLRKRDGIPQIKKQSWDLIIFNQLIQLNSYINAKTIHLYISNNDRNEVDTSQIIDHSFLTDKKIVVPKVIEDNQLKHIEIKSTNHWEQNQWGIPEPVDGEEVNIREMDLIIVPMVAGDRQRNRLGYGKGYYDRFLEKSNAYKIGLLYDLQIHPEELPVENFDIPLDLLLTQSEQI